jgi:hypothetical protein
LCQRLQAACLESKEELAKADLLANFFQLAVEQNKQKESLYSVAQRLLLEWMTLKTLWQPPLADQATDLGLHPQNLAWRCEQVIFRMRTTTALMIEMSLHLCQRLLLHLQRLLL